MDVRRCPDGACCRMHKMFQLEMKWIHDYARVVAAWENAVFLADFQLCFSHKPVRTNDHPARVHADLGRRHTIAVPAAYTRISDGFADSSKYPTAQPPFEDCR